MMRRVVTIALSVMPAPGGCTQDRGGTTIAVYNGQHPQLTSALVTAFEKSTGSGVHRA
jgi:hypothetical protein